MCAIGGFCEFRTDYRERRRQMEDILWKMNRAQRRRGPDEEGIYLGSHCALSHVRLSIIDLTSGQQPLRRREGDWSAAIAYNGELYNMRELREELKRKGAVFCTESDTEVVLAGYQLEGIDFVKKMNGIFAFAIWDEARKKLFLFRDRAGVKPLFYAWCGDTFLFSSEIKGILCYPGMKPEVGCEGLCEVFGIGPAKTYGKGVFCGVHEILPGAWAEISADGFRSEAYWELQSCEHKDSLSETVEKTRFLVTDAIKLQMLSDVPVCTFLSGGVDSSLVTAVCSKKLKEEGRVLSTYSFDFKGNDRNFKANAFQPSQDRPWVERMVEYAGTDHRFLECSKEELFDDLYEAVEARDLPCMADVESSMLHFCRKVSRRHKVVLTGECADEIFGGYPWFHKKECFEADIFPWSMDFAPRTMLLKEEVLRELPLLEYARAAYRKTIHETPGLEGEAPEEKRRREISYLNLKWFMQTLLDRMDRTSMRTGLEARVPFADHRIIEYVFNVPWSMKCCNGQVKGLLRSAGEDLLPDEILYRGKSPYPKTYDPAYEKLVKDRIRDVLYDPNAPLMRFIDRKKAERFMNSPSDYGRPFYGQLMAGPQLLAYLLQVNYWLSHYNINIVS